MSKYRNKRAPLKRKDAAWQGHREEAEALRRDIAQAALGYDCVLHVSTVTCGKTTFPHWRFIRDEECILQAWPTSLSFMHRDGRKGKVRTLRQLLPLLSAEQDDGMENLRSVQREMF